MLIAVIKSTGSSDVEVVFAEDGFVASEEEGELEVPENDLNPIAAEPKEMAWGFGAFVVLFVVLRVWLFPKVRDGMRQRYDSIQADKETADTLTASARADVAEYEARLTSVRVEAQHKVDAARTTLEAERAERLATANSAIAERRGVATAEVDAARAAAMGDVESAVVDVVGVAAQMATSAPIDADTVHSAVRSVMSAEVTS